jgi:hypothetical protein
VTRLAAIILAVFAATLAALVPARAQSFPERPVNVIAEETKLWQAVARESGVHLE